MCGRNANLKYDTWTAAAISITSPNTSRCRAEVFAVSNTSALRSVGGLQRLIAASGTAFAGVRTSDPNLEISRLPAGMTSSRERRNSPGALAAGHIAPQLYHDPPRQVCQFIGLKYAVAYNLACIWLVNDLSGREILTNWEFWSAGQQRIHRRRTPRRGVVTRQNPDAAS